MKKVEVTTKEQLDKLYNESAFTIEGLNTDDKNLNALKQFIERYDAWTDDAEFWIIEGKVMNEQYHLTGSNAYPDDTAIVAVPGTDLMKLVFPRFKIGGRWFDDIVDNNAAREREADDEDDEED